MPDQKSPFPPPRDAKSADTPDDKQPNGDAGSSGNKPASPTTNAPGGEKAHKSNGSLAATPKALGSALTKSEKKLETARNTLVSEYKALGEMLETITDPENSATAHNVRQKTEKVAKLYEDAMGAKSAALQTRSKVNRVQGHAVMDFLGAGEMDVDLSEAVALMDKGASRKDVLAALSRAVADAGAA
tara:strand:- start:1212 stop:1772 length:561 start_codon:yes stop_codon:yes gene_type:complete